MKVTIETNEEKEQEITFPCLMEYNNRELTIWLNSDGKGLVLESKTAAYEKGQYCDFNIKAFKPLPKGTKVILEN